MWLILLLIRDMPSLSSDLNVVNGMQTFHENGYYIHGVGTFVAFYHFSLIHASYHLLCAIVQMYVYVLSP